MKKKTIKETNKLPFELVNMEDAVIIEGRSYVKFTGTDSKDYGIDITPIVEATTDVHKKLFNDMAKDIEKKGYMRGVFEANQTKKKSVLDNAGFKLT
jgi:hypothetical protein